MKRIIGITLCMAMMASVGAVSAEVETSAQGNFVTEITGSTGDEITPYAPICMTCMAGNIFVSKDYLGWQRTGEERSCVHHVYGTDLEMTTTVVETMRCNNSHCGIYTSTTYQENRWDCYGIIT